MPIRALAAILISTLLLGGCGYSLVGRASNLPEDIGSIYLAPLENATARAQVEQILTQAVADELVTRQRLRVESDRRLADSEVSGTVTNFRVFPVSFGEDGRASTYEIQIDLKIAFKRTSNEETLWSRDNYRFRENYEIETDVAAFFDREILALEEVAEKFAETLVTDLFEGF